MGSAALAAAGVMTRVLGLDLSLTGTGYALSEEIVGTLRTKSKGPRRLVEIREFVMELAHDADVVVIEGYSYASENVAHQIGELGGVIRVALYQARLPYTVVAPTTLKKFATGRGNASKDEVLSAAIRRYGFEGEGQDAAEAWILREMGWLHYDVMEGALPGFVVEALAKVEWPTLDREVVSKQT